MHIAFTLCSINYLAQAKTLGESLLRHNPDHRFIIGLIDKNASGVDLSFLGGLELVEVASVGIPSFDEMCARYNIVELVTSTKPFYFDHLFKRYPDAETVTYFDPDIKVFTSLDGMVERLSRSNLILTPHVTQPITDDKSPTEKNVYNTGVFNLGFAAMRRSAEVDRLNAWWMGKLRRECLLDQSAGYFVDQLWMNLAPAYFEGVLIEKHPGWNTAHWNLHERQLRQADGRWLVNEQPLVFYHFSHFSPKKPDVIAAFHTRFSFATRPDLVPLYREYKDDLLRNRYLDLIGVRCHYMQNEQKKRWKRQAETWLRQNVPMSVKIKLGKLIKGL